MRALRSLRVRLIISYLCLALFLLSVFAVVFWRVIGEYSLSVQREQEFTRYREVQDYLTELSGQAYSVDEVLAKLQQAFPDVEVSWRAVADPVVLPPRDGEVPGPRRSTPPGVYQPRPEARHDRWVSLCQTDAGPVLLEFAIPPASPGAVVRTLILQVLAVLVVTLLFAAGIAWWLSRWLARPVAALAESTAAVAAGDFSRTVDQVAVLELNELVTQFNRMIRNVRESLEALRAERDLARRFTADAAHELRTPLSTLRAYTDLLLERPDRAEKVLPSVARQVDRMEYTVSGLLEIASISEGSALRLETADLVQAVRSLEPGLQDMVDEYGQRLVVDLPDWPLSVRLDLQLLSRLLDNLVENACKYSNQGTRITVRVRRDEQHAVLSVIDQGRGIAPEDLPFVFDRFHRGVNTQEIRGSGLGLAIAKEAVRRLGGSIGVESEVGVGSTFRVLLPLVAPETR